MVAGLEHMVYKKLRRLGLFRLEKQGLTKRNPLVSSAAWRSYRRHHFQGCTQGEERGKSQSDIRKKAFTRTG